MTYCKTSTLACRLRIASMVVLSMVGPFVNGCGVESASCHGADRPPVFLSWLELPVGALLEQAGLRRVA